MYNNIMSINVLDSWEGWEGLEACEIMNKPLNSQQHKILEERKLMEEADNELTKNLFSVTPPIKQEDKTEPAFKKPERIKEPFNKNKNKNKTQKDLSIKINNRNQAQKKQNEMFGECDDKTYVNYCEIEEKYLD